MLFSEEIYRKFIGTSITFEDIKRIIPEWESYRTETMEDEIVFEKILQFRYTRAELMEIMREVPDNYLIELNHDEEKLIVMRKVGRLETDNEVLRRLMFAIKVNTTKIERTDLAMANVTDDFLKRLANNSEIMSTLERLKDR
jgi:hypothetical protein